MLLRPCKRCLVRPSCRIRSSKENRPLYYKCGCVKYEIYKLKLILKQTQKNRNFNIDLQVKLVQRLRELDAYE